MENDRDTSLQSRTFLTLFLPRLFFLSCFAATGYAFLLVLFVPLSPESWLFFGSMAPFAAGSYLYVRATKVPNGSLLFGDPPGGSDATTPLLAKPVVKVQP